MDEMGMFFSKNKATINNNSTTSSQESINNMYTIPQAVKDELEVFNFINSTSVSLRQ